VLYSGDVAGLERFRVILAGWYSGFDGYPMYSCACDALESLSSALEDDVKIVRQRSSLTD
jgi:hypothetical protein